MVYPEGRPEQFTFMLVNGRVARVDILADGYLTDKGARVGWCGGRCSQSLRRPREGVSEQV